MIPVLGTGMESQDLLTVLSTYSRKFGKMNKFLRIGLKGLSLSLERRVTPHIVLTIEE